MTSRQPQKNRSEMICVALRSAILERALLPGMKLPEDSLGERFGASRTIVRQALERLAAEGLVELRHNRGAAVASPSLEEAQDLFGLRAQVSRRRKPVLFNRLNHFRFQHPTPISNAKSAILHMPASTPRNLRHFGS